MKRSCKIVAVIMSVILFIGIISPCYAQPENTAEKISSDIYNESLSSFGLLQFYRFCNAFDMITSLLTGKEIFGARKVFKVYLDKELTEICQYISDNSVLDLYGLVTNFPDISAPVRFAVDTFNIDTVKLKEKLCATKDQLDAEGKYTESAILLFIISYVSVIEECNIRLDPYSADTYKLVVDVTYADGTTESFPQDFYYNPETGIVSGNGETGLLGLGFNFSVKEMLVYAPIDCWMRHYGFCFGYDLAAYILPCFSYETHRYKFDYDGKQWMIQLWKGNYVAANGGEVGVYNRDPATAKGSYYDCLQDDELVPMSMQIYHGDELLVDRAEQPHWWINGFKIADEFYSPEELTMKSTITMKDEDMLMAFCESIDNSLYNDLSYTFDGLKVSIVW